MAQAFKMNIAIAAAKNCCPKYSVFGRIYTDPLYMKKVWICVRSPAVTAPLNLTTSYGVLFHCSGRLIEQGILGDIVNATILGLGLRLHRLGLEEISGDWRWLSLGNAVLETGVAQICHEGFSITFLESNIGSTVPRIVLMATNSWAVYLKSYQMCCDSF